jgi:hypothetical protein
VGSCTNSACAGGALSLGPTTTVRSHFCGAPAVHRGLHPQPQPPQDLRSDQARRPLPARPHKPVAVRLRTPRGRPEVPSRWPGREPTSGIPIFELSIAAVQKGRWDQSSGKVLTGASLYIVALATRFTIATVAGPRPASRGRSCSRRSGWVCPGPQPRRPARQLLYDARGEASLSAR